VKTRNVPCLDAFLRVGIMRLHISARQNHTFGTVNKNGANPYEIANASEPVSARLEGITRVIHTGAQGDINTINSTEESCSRTQSFTKSKFQLIS
jgi:hypothetical protein